MANELRLRGGFVAGALSADLAIAATSMSSAGLADLPVVDSTDHAEITLFQTDAAGRVTKKEVVYVTAHTASATTATIVKAQEGTSDQAWNGTSSPDKWTHGPTIRDFATGRAAYKRRTSGNITVTGTASTWADLDTGLDLTVNAWAGDIVEVSFSAAGADSATNYLIVDAASLVSGSPVNYWSNDGAESATSYGVAAWLMVGGRIGQAAGSCVRRLGAGDISAGKLTVRFRTRSDNSGSGNKVVQASADLPINVSLVNHGPQEA